MTIDTSELLTAAETASILGLHYDSLRRLVRHGVGPTPIALSHRAIFFRKADVEGFRNERSTTATTAAAL